MARRAITRERKQMKILDSLRGPSLKPRLFASILLLFALWRGADYRRIALAFDKNPDAPVKRVSQGRNRVLTRNISLPTSILAVALSPDGEVMACASEPPEGKDWPPETKSEALGGKNIAFYGYSNARGFLGLWHVKSGKMIRMIRFRTVIEEMEFSPDGRTLVTSSHDYSVNPYKGGLESSVRVWDVKSGRLMHTLGISTRTIAFSPDGRLAAFNDGDIQLFDSKTWKLRRSFVQERPVGVPFGLQFSKDSRSLAAVTYSRETMLGSLSVWDVVSGVNLINLGNERYDDRAMNIGFPVAFVDSGKSSHPSERVLICGDNYVFCKAGRKNWRFSHFRRIVGTEERSLVAVHTGRRTLAVYSPGGFGPQYELWDVNRKIKGRTWSTPSELSTQVKFNSAGSRLVSAGDKTATVMELSGPKRKAIQKARTPSRSQG